MDSEHKLKFIKEWMDDKNAYHFNSVKHNNTVDKVYNIIYNWDYFTGNLSEIVQDNTLEEFILLKGDELLEINHLQLTVDDINSAQLAGKNTENVLYRAYYMLLLRHVSRLVSLNKTDLTDHIIKKYVKYKHLDEKYNIFKNKGILDYHVHSSQDSNAYYNFYQ